jgi:hypothetical protein
MKNENHYKARLLIKFLNFYLKHQWQIIPGSELTFFLQILVKQLTSKKKELTQEKDCDSN